MLQKLFKKIGESKKGFTLVELMVVVVIIGVLTAIAVPVYNSSTEKAKLNAHLANIRIIEGAIEQWKIDNEDVDISNLDADATTSTTLVSKYIKEWPTKPGTYTVENGVLTANPTKAATQTAASGGAAVTWPK